MIAGILAVIALIIIGCSGGAIVAHFENKEYDKTMKKLRSSVEEAGVNVYKSSDGEWYAFFNSNVFFSTEKQCLEAIVASKNIKVK